MSDAWLSPSNNSNARAIREVQMSLGLHPDGQYSTATVRAVSDFQNANALTADGLVGPATWAAFAGEKPAAKKKASPKKSVEAKKTPVKKAPAKKSSSSK